MTGESDALKQLHITQTELEATAKKLSADRIENTKPSICDICLVGSNITVDERRVIGICQTCGHLIEL